MILPSLDPCLEMDARPRVETFGSGGIMQRFRAQPHKALPQVHYLLRNDVFSIYCVLSKVLPGDGVTAWSNSYEDHSGGFGWWREALGLVGTGCRCGISGWVRCTWPVDTVSSGVRQIQCHISHPENTFWTLQCGSIAMPARGFLTDLRLEVSILACQEAGFLPLFLSLLKNSRERNQSETLPREHIVE